MEHNVVIFDNREEAEEVLRLMNHLVAERGYVTVADLFEIVGLPDRSFGHLLGWVDLTNAEVTQEDGAYSQNHLLNLPQPKRIDLEGNVVGRHRKRTPGRGVYILMLLLRPWPTPALRALERTLIRLMPKE